jgi:hypothetical protein
VIDRVVGHLRVAIVVLLVGWGSSAWAEEAAEPLESTRSPLTLRLDLRLRYNTIEQGNKPQKVDVTTVRFAPGVEVKLSPSLTLTAEVIHTDFIGPKRFNDDPASFSSPYPLLPDPRYSGLNQTTLAWTPLPDLELIVGRQALKIGNERQVSDNNFRQIPQLFDGALARWAPFDGSSLQLGYFPQMRSFFGNEEQARLGIFEWAFNPLKDVSTTLYAFRHHPAAAASNAFLYGASDYSNLTYGATLDASTSIDSVRASFTGELAHQQAAAGGSPYISSNYYRLGVGATLRDWTLRVDHENRASNAGHTAFQTVLSDYYAYNGNSLVFFAAPNDGLRDTWLTLRWERGPWSMLHEYHAFRSDVGDKKYGRELDLNFTYNWTKHWYSRAQWAHYRPEEQRHVDVDKVWLTLGYLVR